MIGLFLWIYFIQLTKQTEIVQQKQFTNNFTGFSMNLNFVL